MPLRHILLVLALVAAPAAAQETAAEEGFTLGPAAAGPAGGDPFALPSEAARPPETGSALRAFEEGRLAARARRCPFAARTVFGDEASPGMTLSLDAHEGRLALAESQGALNDYVSGGLDARPCR
jgi:hypothetical protein